MQKIKEKLKLTSITLPITMALTNLKTYATSTIGTQEVEMATDNIKQAVIKLAMPIRKCVNVCKYCYYCN